jgi:hypothetical protein
MHKHLFLFAVCQFVLASASVAQTADTSSAPAKTEALTAFKELESRVELDIYTCELQARTGLLRLSLGQQANTDVKDCTEKAKSSVSHRYAVIKSKLGSDRDTLTALNDYAASVLATLDDLEPRGAEREAAYAYRIRNSETGLKRKANLVKLQLM